MQKIQLRNRFFSVLLLCLIFLFIHPTPKSFAENYVIGPGDVLKIDVYDHDDLKKTVRVSNNGTITVPFIGRVQVGGNTIPEVTKKLTSLLADGYIVNPQVNIFIEEFRSKKVIILGQVNQPGIVKLRGSTTFLEIISQAGGLKQDAGDTATIKREQNGTQEVFVVDIKLMVEGGDLSQNILIHDGDTIYVPKGGMCYVTGEVSSPDAYPCGKDTTVLKLIARSGGFTGKASKSGVRIIRIVDGQKTTFKNVDLGTQVFSNDIIVVPESFF